MKRRKKNLLLYSGPLQAQKIWHHKGSLCTFVDLRTQIREKRLKTKKLRTIVNKVFKSPNATTATIDFPSYPVQKIVFIIINNWISAFYSRRKFLASVKKTLSCIFGQKSPLFFKPDIRASQLFLKNRATLSHKILIYFHLVWQFHLLVFSL